MRDHRPIRSNCVPIGSWEGNFEFSLEMAMICEGCDWARIPAFGNFYNDDEKSIQFLRRHGVLPSSVECPNCKKPCTLRDRHLWRCNAEIAIPKTKKRKKCGFCVSDYKGTFLDHCHIAPWKLVCFVISWLEKKGFSHLEINRSLGLSSHTSVDWRSFCAEVTEDFLNNQPPIGGSGVIVEIDESKFGKSKYGRGREVEGVWVFGGIERVSKKCFIVPLLETGRRDADTLLPLIQKYIQAGSTIVSDEWAAYRKIGQLGYTHKTINHSEQFVDPSDRSIHTQNIERLWEDAKAHVLKAGLRRQYYRQYLGRFLFLRANGYWKKLHAFFIAAGRLYPPQSDRRRELPGPSGASNAPSLPEVSDEESDSS